MTTTVASAVMMVYVDEMIESPPESQLAPAYRTAVGPGMNKVDMMAYDEDKTNTDFLFPKQDFQESGSSFRIINETELSEVLTSNDEVTAIFVTGLVTAYVVCLSLPVIFVTACSLYIKRMNRAERRRFRQMMQRQTVATKPAPLSLSRLNESPLPNKSNEIKHDPVKSPGNNDDVFSDIHSNLASPNTPRRAGLLKKSDHNETVIPLLPLFKDWREIDNSIRDHQNPGAREFPNLYDTPPPPPLFADQKPEPLSPTELATALSYSSSVTSGEPKTKKSRNVSFTFGYGKAPDSFYSEV